MENDMIALPERIYKIYSSCSKQEQKYLKQILEELSVDGTSSTYRDIWLQDYKEIPVDLDTFLCDDYYLGSTNRHGDAIYPYWRKGLHTIFDAGNLYHECVFTGATRIGKTSTAITASTYMLYRLMCLRDPQKFFGKKDVSKFSVMFFNITKDLAKGVAYREFNDTVWASPWFRAHGTRSQSERDFYYIPEGDKISIDFGSEASHSLGKQIYIGFLDECSFAKAGVKDINKAKARMKELYDSVVARVEGTFRQQGEVFGKVFAVSSKKSDSDFMESHIEKQLAAGNKHMLVLGGSQWDIMPPSMFSSDTFNIAVGDRRHKGFVIENNSEESLKELKDQGYQILTIPIDMKSNFIADFDISLRDLAGIAVPGALSYISQESINECIGNRRNPFLNEILEIGTHDNLTIEEFFHIEYVPESLKQNKIYIHVDLSLNTDRTGISGAGATSTKDIKLDDGSYISMPFISHMFSISIQAPRGDKIPYSKILAFICWLRRSGFNVVMVSRDQFQSEYLGELLESQGFDSPKRSLDRTADGYTTLRSVLLENRIDMLDCEILQNELIHLQRDAITGKIDHPIGGSKDVSDSFAGCVWDIILDNPGVPIQTKKVANIMSTVNGRSNSIQSNLPAMFPNLNKRYGRIR